VEPQLPVSGSEIQIGNVEAGRQKTLAVYLDPQICGTTPVDGIITYKDARGQLYPMNLKRFQVEVKCPLFFTPEEANTAMLKNLLEQQLMNRDAKVFALPVDMDRSKAFGLAKEAITALDVRLISEYSRAANLEAWFYGQIKGSGERMILRASVIGESIELFIAANTRTAITGLLAELRRAFIQRMHETGYRTVQITNNIIRESIINRSTLFMEASGGPKS
jgi:hypothetical protein